MVGYQAQRMNLPHQNVRRYFVELYVLQKVADDIFEIRIGIAIAVFLAYNDKKCLIQHLNLEKTETN